jgi:hypothetical protein
VNVGANANRFQILSKMTDQLVNLKEYKLDKQNELRIDVDIGQTAFLKVVDDYLSGSFDFFLHFYI